MDHQSQMPHFLYRAFEKLEYARDFVEHGRFRMGLLSYYTNIEDKVRRDPTEGHGKIKQGVVTTEAENFNCKYLLCCSNPDVDLDRMKSPPRKYIVKINDPLRLAQDVTTWLQNKGIPNPDVEWMKIRYDKGLPVQKSLTKSQLAELSYTQKEQKFSWEREYRLVVITSDIVDCEDFLWLDIGCALTYIEHL